MHRFLLAACVFLASSLLAAPSQRRYDYEDTRATIADMQHQIGNQQYDMKVFEARLETLDATLEAMRSDVQQSRQQQKDKIASAAYDIDAKLGAFDVSAKGISSENKILKGQVSEMVNALAAYKGRLASLEKIIEAQNQNIESLQTALRALTDTLQDKEVGKATKTYVVKKNDALEIIGRAHGMSVDELKKLNGLSNEKIFVGQKLLIYDR
jgi:LysM repeat protein